MLLAALAVEELLPMMSSVSVAAGGGTVVDTVVAAADVVVDREGSTVGRQFRTFWLSVVPSLLSWHLVQHECSLLEKINKIIKY